jgi:hypothetical protein
MLPASRGAVDDHAAALVDEHSSTPGRDTVAMVLDFVRQEEDADAGARLHGPGGGDLLPIWPR